MSFAEYISAFHTVTADEADALLKANAKNIVFIGRESCGFCHIFAEKLAKVAADKGLKIHFLHSARKDDMNSIIEFRQKYGVPTVPGFLYSDEEGVKVKCDSSMSEEEIAEFVKA